MKLRRLLVLLIALQPYSWAHAADIVSDVPRLISGDGDVATAGITFGAFNLGAGGVFGHHGE